MPDLDDVLNILYLALAVTTLCVIVNISNKLIKLGYHYCDVYSKSARSVGRFEPSPQIKSDYINTKSPSFDRDMKVEQLAPETIAPALKNPPKPAGGFGSKVK